MSKRDDRARAELGLIFRDGHVWKKKDWYKLHPTPEILAAKVELADVFETTAYYCYKCMRKHRAGSKVYEAHREHLGQEA